MVEIIAEEQNKVKRMKITEDSPRALCDNIKCINIQILGVLDKEEKKRERKGMRKFLKRLQLKISPTWTRKLSIKSKKQESHTG